MIIYDGPSLFDGAPILVIVTGLERPSVNRKTGPMVQVYIMVKGMHPLRAVDSGADRAVCATCKWMGRIETDADGARKNVDRVCYVMVNHGPTSMWNALQDGNYQLVPLTVARKLLRGRRVRIGAYGDPGVVPIEVWKTALERVDGVTSYTHMWRERPELASFCMASVDTEEEQAEAKRLGFRTFRTRPPGAPRLKGEGNCPASEEMNNVTQCVRCMLCDGHTTGKRGDITIIAHGRGKKFFFHAVNSATPAGTSLPSSLHEGKEVETCG